MGGNPVQVDAPAIKVLVPPHTACSRRTMRLATSDQTNAKERAKSVCILDNPIGATLDDLRAFEMRVVLYPKEDAARLFRGTPDAQDGFIRLFASQNHRSTQPIDTDPYTSVTAPPRASVTQEFTPGAGRWGNGEFLVTGGCVKLYQ